MTDNEQTTSTSNDHDQGMYARIGWALCAMYLLYFVGDTTAREQFGTMQGAGDPITFAEHPVFFSVSLAGILVLSFVLLYIAFRPSRGR